MVCRVYGYSGVLVYGAQQVRSAEWNGESLESLGINPAKTLLQSYPVWAKASFIITSVRGAIKNMNYRKPRGEKL